MHRRRRWDDRTGTRLRRQRLDDLGPRGPRVYGIDIYIYIYNNMSNN